MKYSLFIILIGFLFIGCSEPTINMNTTPKIQIPKQQIIPQRKKGSLYSQTGTSLFADKKDLQIGDILQVIVEETLKNDSKGSRGIKRSNSNSLGGGIIAPTTGNTLTKGGQDRANKFNQSFGLGFSSASVNSFAGSSISKVDEKFSTTISVIIEQTYKNGNYFVKGSREMLIDGQKQSMLISGVIRPYDITPENTVYSHQLANLKIRYLKDGEENNGIHKGWGTKIIESIWPF